MHTPPPDCPLCPRLYAFRQENRVKYPHFFNNPVPAFGTIDAQVLIVGLAPGLQGANQTGRPFTGDYAGFALYPALAKFGFAEGDYLATIPGTLEKRIPPPVGARREEASRLGGGRSSENLSVPITPPSQPSPYGGRSKGDFHLINCRISNAVRCVPPENKPEPSEIKTCNQFLQSEIKSMPNLRVIISLGLVSHNAVLKAFGLKAGHAKFTHGLVSPLAPHIRLLDSYHCSRYNINTGRLTQTMFDGIIKQAYSIISAA